MITDGYSSLTTLDSWRDIFKFGRQFLIQYTTLYSIVNLILAVWTYRSNPPGEPDPLT